MASACVLDDHSRIAYVELHPREDAETNARTLERALRFFVELGLDPTQAEMTDNALVHSNSRRFKHLLDDHSIQHIRTPIYMPRWNGKVERFSRTLQDEWAYRRVWPNSATHAPEGGVNYRERPSSSCVSRMALSRFRSFRFARRIAAASTGAVSFEKPAGSPRLRSVILVLPVCVSCHV